MYIQPQNNKFNYLIDPSFANVRRLFVLPFTRTDTHNYRNSFSHYYVPDIEISSKNYGHEQQ